VDSLPNSARAGLTTCLNNARKDTLMERHLGVIEVSLMGHLILSIFKMKYYYVTLPRFGGVLRGEN